MRDRDRDRASESVRVRERAMMTKNKNGTREWQEGKKAHRQEGHRANLDSKRKREEKRKRMRCFEGSKIKNASPLIRNTLSTAIKGDGDGDGDGGGDV